MQRIRQLSLIAGLAAATLAPSGWADVPAAASTEQRLAEMEARLRQQQEEIAALRAELQEQRQTTAAVNARWSDASIAEAVSAAAYAQAKDDTLLKLGKNTSRLKIGGDFRFRHQVDERGDNSSASAEDPEQRNRTRVRFRLGTDFTLTDSWTILAGLATGNADGRSTNQTYASEGYVFSTPDIRLDYAYAQGQWQPSEGTTTRLLIGQQKHPYLTSWVHWDTDLRPAGVTGQVESNGFFATAGWYTLAASDAWEQSDAMLLAGHAGYGGQFDCGDGKGDYKVALAYYGFNDVTTTSGDPALQAAALAGGVNNDEYAFQVVDLYGEVGVKPKDLPEAKLYANVWQNLSADGSASQVSTGAPALDPSDNDLGYVLGVDGKYGKFSLGYAYAHVEADSTFGKIVDADFATAVGDTNTEGHILRAGYEVTKSLTLNVTAMFTSTIEEESGWGDGSLYQFDANWKF